MSLLSEAFGVDSFPAGWETRPLHAVAIERRGNKNDGLLEENLLSLSYGSIVRKDIKSDGGLLPESFEGYQIVEAGDLVMRLTDLQNDKRSLRSGLCNERGIITSAYLALEPRGIDPRYFAYLMRAYDTAKVLYPLGGGLRQSLKFEDVRLLPVLVPPVEEQRRIADFLDDQVALIDSLIQSRVRQQVLHQASYLEQVRYLTSHGAPSTWRVAHAFMTGSGTTPKSDHPEYFEGATPWVMSGDLNDGLVNETEKTVSAEALEVYSALKVYPPGTLLVAMYGATVGRTGRLGVSACVNQAVCALQERGPVSAEYAQYWFVGRRTEIIELASGGGQPNISQEIVRNLRITTGDANWQRDRIHSIRRVATQIEDVYSTGMRSVDLLEERKRSLITAAVTGALDVTTAKPIGMGKWVPNVGASVEARAAAQSSGIGGIR